MGSKAFLSMGVLFFTALLFTSDQVIARDPAETPTYHKNEDGTIKPNGVGKAKNVYERSFSDRNDVGHRGNRNPIYNRNGRDYATPYAFDPNRPAICGRSPLPPCTSKPSPYVRGYPPTPYAFDPNRPANCGRSPLPPCTSKPSPYVRGYPPAYNRGGYP